MRSARPFMVRYGEGLIVAGCGGAVFSVFSDAVLPVLLAGCVAAATGAILLYAGHRAAKNRSAG